MFKRNRNYGHNVICIMYSTSFVLRKKFGRLNIWKHNQAFGGWGDSYHKLPINILRANLEATSALDIL